MSNEGGEANPEQLTIRVRDQVRVVCSTWSAVLLENVPVPVPVKRAGVPFNGELGILSTDAFPDSCLDNLLTRSAGKLIFHFEIL